MGEDAMTADQNADTCFVKLRASIVSGVVHAVRAIALAALFAPAVAAEPDARQFAAQALALRAAGVAGEAQVAEIVAGIPGVGTLGAKETLAALWSPFFENAIVKLGRLRSPTPVALYYNPILDVSLFTLWQERDSFYRITSVDASPGERIADTDAAVTLHPPWAAAKDGPVAAIRRVATDRLIAFARAHPAEVRKSARNGRTYAAAAADMREARSRLVWNAAMRASWVGESSGWLGPALERIDATLATRDAVTIGVAAPETDSVTAEALARLPAEFVSALVLDMTLKINTTDRLLIASSPDDGHVYAFVLCRLDGTSCALRRFLLMTVE